LPAKRTNLAPSPFAQCRPIGRKAKTPNQPPDLRRENRQASQGCKRPPRGKPNLAPPPLGHK